MAAGGRRRRRRRAGASPGPPRRELRAPGRGTAGRTGRDAARPSAEPSGLPDPSLGRPIRGRRRPGVGPTPASATGRSSPVPADAAGLPNGCSARGSGARPAACWASRWRRSPARASAEIAEATGNWPLTGWFTAEGLPRTSRRPAGRGTGAAPSPPWPRTSTACPRTTTSTSRSWACRCWSATAGTSPPRTSPDVAGRAARGPRLHRGTGGVPQPARRASSPRAPRRGATRSGNGSAR